LIYRNQTSFILCEDRNQVGTRSTAYAQMRFFAKRHKRVFGSVQSTNRGFEVRPSRINNDYARVTDSLRLVVSEGHGLQPR